VFVTDTMLGKALVEKVPKYVKKYVDFFSELCCQDHSFKRYLPSALAAAIVVAARRALNVKPMWTPELETLLRMDKTRVQPILMHVWTYYRESFPAECSAADRHFGDHISVLTDRAMAVKVGKVGKGPGMAPHHG
jgi:hypothetical protein